jgi:hypothetical protein
VVKPVYRNVHVHNAVTIIHRDTFLFGKKIALKKRHNPFLKAKPSYGPPGIQWKKAQKHRVVKKIVVHGKPGKHKRVIKAKRVHEGNDRRVVASVKKRGRPLSVERKERIERKAPKSHAARGRAPEKMTKRMRGKEREGKEVQRVRKPLRKAESGNNQKVVERKTARGPELKGRRSLEKERRLVRKGPQKRERAVQEGPRHSRDVKTVKPKAGTKPPGRSELRKQENPAKRNGFLRARR